MSIRNIPGGEGRPARKADNLTAICEPIVYKNLGASTSHSPMGLHGRYRATLPLPLIIPFILGPNILFSTVVSNNLDIGSFLGIRDQVNSIQFVFIYVEI
jgi:hypothetical protein